MNNKYFCNFLPFFLSSAALFSAPVNAVEISQGELAGNFDTTISLGASWRVQGKDPELLGRSRVDGTGFSANGDDGNINYDKGLISQAIKVTHDLDLDYQNFGAFFRASYFYDFHNNDKGELSQAAKDRIGKDFELLDAYIEGNFQAGGKNLDVRVGSQVVSWGESTFIQNGINVINPVDVSKFRVPGAELREGLIPSPLVWASFELNDRASVEAFYLTQFDHTKIDPSGAYFSTNDFAGDGGQYVLRGFGSLDGSACPGDVVNCLPRIADRDAKDSGQFGLALRYYSPELNDTEFGLFYVNYHSRLPLISAHAFTAAPADGDVFIEYPEDIHLTGVSFNTVLGKSGVALQGEYSHRSNVPLQVEDIEILLAYLKSAASQLGAGIAGQEISGFRRHEVGQLQFTLTKAFGAGNPFNANEWIVLGEIGATKVYDLPDKSVLRYEGPGTVTPANAAVAGASSIPTQTDGYADDFSWGYRLVTRLDYNAAIGAVNLSPRIAFAHDVHGTSPGPGGNFVEGRKALTLGLGGNYLNKWSGDLSYTRYYGAGIFNRIHDRDFVSMNVKYSF